MGFLDKTINKVTGAYAGFLTGAETLRDTAEHAENLEVQLKGHEASALAEVELAIDDIGWKETGGGRNSWNFKRSSLMTLLRLSRVMYLLNPLIRRAVTVQELYVFGSGVTIKGQDKIVDEVIQDFFQDPQNQRVIGENWATREREQRIDGNTFFLIYRNRKNGRARIRVLPPYMIEDIICNPEDAMEPWYYVRSESTGSDSGFSQMFDELPVGPRCVYPCIDYNPRVKPSKTKDNIPVKWDVRVLHVSTGALSEMKFGIPELLSALFWAIGYKKILENFATILSCYARMAMTVSGLGGKKGTAAAKTKLNTGITPGTFNDTNPPNNVAGWALLSGNAEIKAVKTANSTTAPDEARALRSMVASGTDTPEHFFGDSDIGNFATSTTLDRPTELKMVARQKMWMYIILHLCNKVIEYSAVAPQGKLRKAGYRAEVISDYFDGRNQNVIITPPENGTIKVKVKFPKIVQREVVERVRAVVQAATLGGSAAEGIFPDRKYVFGLLVEALGEDDAEAIMEQYYPDPVPQGWVDPRERLAVDELKAEGTKELGDAAVKKAQTDARRPAPQRGAGSPAVSN